jgi:hypothetical protein
MSKLFCKVVKDDYLINTHRLDGEKLDGTRKNALKLYLGPLIFVTEIVNRILAWVQVFQFFICTCSANRYDQKHE